MTSIKPMIVLIAAFFLGACATSAETMKAERESNAHFKMGVSYLNDNSLQPAFLEFQKAVELNPKDKQAHYYLGHVYFLQKKDPEAILEFERVVKLDPDYSDAYNHAGVVYETDGNLDSALKSYQKALNNKAYEKPHFVHYNIAGIYLKQNKPKEAIAEYHEAINIDPGYFLAYRALGETYLRTNDRKQGVYFLEEASKLSPEDPVTHFRLGEVYQTEKMYQKADVEFKKVIALVPPESDLAKEAKKHLEGRR